jgi:hypothetical protein
MANVDWGNAWKSIFDAAKAALGQQPKEVVHFLEGETKKLAITLESITSGYAGGLTSKAEMEINLNGQKVASQAVLTAAAGMTAVMAQKAINAGLDAVRKIVNELLGFELIPPFPPA